MSLHSVKEINSLSDPLKMFLCKFVITVPPNSPFSSDFAEQLELRAQTFNFPKITGDKTEVTWGGHNRQYAGKQQRQGDWTVKFTEVYDGKVLDNFKAWVNLYHKYLDGKINLFDQYATTIDVEIYNPSLYAKETTEKPTALNIQLNRAWPVDVSASEIDANSSNPVEITTTIHYDYFLIGDEVDAAKGS